VNASELAERAPALPDRFSDRLDPKDLTSIRRIASGGEWTEEIDLLLACLQHDKITITTAEREELQAVLDAIKKPDGTFDVPEDAPSPQDRLNALRILD
jgi:hypothetical protein